jgi:AhpD family alkylhydroperoxidase
MTTLTEKEHELVALGASIGAGCRPCTRYHVGAALKNGLTVEEVQRAIGEAQSARCEAVSFVGDVGRTSLGIESGGNGDHLQPASREQLLVYLGAAAGGNAADLVKLYASETPGGTRLSGEELRSALEIAEDVKEHAAEFFRRDAERLTAKVTTVTQGPVASCCQAPAATAAEGAEAPCGCQTPATTTEAAEEAETPCGCQTTATTTEASQETGVTNGRQGLPTAALGAGAACGCRGLPAAVFGYQRQS